MYNSEFTPEDLEKTKVVAANLMEALERIGFYAESCQLRAALDPLIVENMDPENPINTIEEIYNNGGSLYVDASFRLNQVAFSPRVQMSEEDRNVRDLLRDQGITDLNMQIQEVLEFSFKDEIDDQEETNDD